MIYYNNTNYKVYFYGYYIEPYSFFIFYNYENYKVEDYFKYIFSKIKGNTDISFIEECKKYNSFIITEINGNIIVNNKICNLNNNCNEYKFTKQDCILIKNNISYSEIIDQDNYR